MNYTLRGSISRTQPYQLDPTLTLEGAGAEAKATGEAIARVQAEVTSHCNNTSNPHNVTKSQLGLGEVDNTSDMDKPVSYAQEEALENARSACMESSANAQTTADEAVVAAGNAQTTADSAQTAADTAQTTADEAKTAAENAQATADSKTAWFSKEVTLVVGDWYSLDNELYCDADVPGVAENQDQPIFVSPVAESEEDYWRYGIWPFSQGNGSVSFRCKRKPACDVAVKIVGFTVPA